MIVSIIIIIIVIIVIIVIIAIIAIICIIAIIVIIVIICIICIIRTRTIVIGREKSRARVREATLTNKFSKKTQSSTSAKAYISNLETLKNIIQKESK